MFKIPKGINKLSEEEVLDLIPDTSPNVRGTKHTRLKLIKLIYMILGFDLPSELLLILLNENSANAVIATAGAGKTTFVQVKILLEKMIRTNPILERPIKGEKILSLVYNNHNVEQLKRKQAQFVAKIKSSGIKGVTVDNELNATTFHAFCKTWISEYSVKCGLVNYKPLDTLQSKQLIRSSMNVLAKKKGLDFTGITIEDILKLYNVAKESLIEYDDIDKLEAFSGITVAKECLITLFQSYDNVKDVRCLYDFSDMLVKFYNLLVNDEEARTHIQRYYDYITADEVQDFSPIMMEILKLVKGEHVPVICIGDEDQSIYGFRGADIYNTLDFEKRFPGGKVFSLGINRRCGENILNAAKSVIQTNTLRFDKEIKGIKPGGNIDFIPYNTQDGQLINLCNKLDKLSTEELENTIICYRKKKSSLLLADILERKGIPFNTLSGYLPFEHELYRHVFDVLDILYRPYDREALLNLYKVTPITKTDLYRVLGYNPKNKRWKDDREVKHFAQYDFGEYNSRVPFLKAIENLLVFSEALSRFTLDEYFSKVYESIIKYFWNYKKSLNEETALDDYYTDEVFKFFNVDKKYEHLESEYLKRKKICKLNNDSREGVTLSTFHGLKGLEYDNVIIIDLDEEIFPNFELIDSIPNISDKIKLNLKECETRLFYVALTRAKKNITLYYNESNPSLYINMLKSNPTTHNKENIIFDEISKMDLFGSDNSNTGVVSPNNFISTDNEIKEKEDNNTKVVEVEEIELELEDIEDIPNIVEQQEQEDEEEIELELEDIKDTTSSTQNTTPSIPEQQESKSSTKEKSDTTKNDECEFTDFLSFTLNRLQK